MSVVQTTYPHNWTIFFHAQWPWTAHVYGLAIAWFLLGLYAFIVAINIGPAVPEKGLLSRMCAQLVLSAILRAMYLLIDPYESKQRLLPYFSRFLYVIVHPCLLGTFVLAMICLFRLGGVRMTCKSLDNVFLVQIMTAGYAMILGVLEVAASFYPLGITPMYILIELLYLLGHLSLALACIHYGAKLLRTLSNHKIDMGFRCYNTKRGETPNLPVPKIRITDENECSMSFKSEPSSMMSQDSTFDLGDDDMRPRTRSGRGSVKITGRQVESNACSKLRKITRFMFAIAFLAMAQAFWIGYERAGRLLGWERVARTPDVWLTLMTLYRVSELLWANLMAYVVQHGFNKI